MGPGSRAPPLAAGRQQLLSRPPRFCRPPTCLDHSSPSDSRHPAARRKVRVGRSGPCRWPSGAGRGSQPPVGDPCCAPRARRQRTCVSGALATSLRSLCSLGSGYAGNRRLWCTFSQRQARPELAGGGPGGSAHGVSDGRMAGAIARREHTTGRPHARCKQLHGTGRINSIRLVGVSSKGERGSSGAAAFRAALEELIR